MEELKGSMVANWYVPRGAWQQLKKRQFYSTFGEKRSKFFKLKRPSSLQINTIHLAPLKEMMCWATGQTGKKFNNCQSILLLIQQPSAQIN